MAMGHGGGDPPNTSWGQTHIWGLPIWVVRVMVFSHLNNLSLGVEFSGPLLGRNCAEMHRFGSMDAHWKSGSEDLLRKGNRIKTFIPATEPPDPTQKGFRRVSEGSLRGSLKGSLKGF